MPGTNSSIPKTVSSNNPVPLNPQMADEKFTVADVGACAAPLQSR